MKILFYTHTHQIYAALILKMLASDRQHHIGVLLAQEYFSGKSLWAQINKVIKDSGWVYFLLRLLESVHNRFLEISHKEKFSLKHIAQQERLPIFFINDINSPKSLAVIKQFSPDCIVCAYGPQMIKKNIFEIPSKGTVNIHRSLLPKDRGPCSAFWQLSRGEKKSGTTLHFIDEGCDTGPILAQRHYPINDNETHHSLCCKSALEAAGLLHDVLNRLQEGEAIVTFQDEHQATKNPFPTSQTAWRFFRTRRMF